MVLTLYKIDGSPPCRAVYLTGKALGITFEYVEVNVFKLEQFKPEFIKLNPQHTVPVLVDDDFVISESHAINAYLVTKYGKQDDTLYPTNSQKRAIIDQRLHFDTGVLIPHIKAVVRPLVFEGEKVIAQNVIDEINKSYDVVNTFLEGHTWIAGDTLTIADFSCIATVTSLNALVPLDVTKHANVIAWIKKAEKLPYYEANLKGLLDFQTYLHNILNSP